VIDLTTLAGDDTEANVHRLGFKAKMPVQIDLVKALQVEDKHITGWPLDTRLFLPDDVVAVGAVCVYPNRVKEMAKALAGTNIPIASVAAGFPAGQTPLPMRLEEIRDAVASGATEIDIVISRNYVLCAQWQELYDEVKAMREACGHAHLKTILATGELSTMTNIYKASLICMMAGADFIKARALWGFTRSHAAADIDRQGGRQCHVPCRPHHDPRHPRLPRAHRSVFFSRFFSPNHPSLLWRLASCRTRSPAILSRLAQDTRLASSLQAECARPRTRWSGCR
jgi:deoxyribose-phosphate aldolase